MDAQLAEFPGVRGWMQRVVAAELAPHWEDVNAMPHKAAAAQGAPASAAGQAVTACMMAAVVYTYVLMLCLHSWLKHCVFRLMRRPALTTSL